MDEAAILHELGKRIRAQRKGIGLTQEALALAANVDRSYYGAVERGGAQRHLHRSLSPLRGSAMRCGEIDKGAAASRLIRVFVFRADDDGIE